MDYNYIDRLIELILIEYNRICNEWEKSCPSVRINLKKKLVRDIRNDVGIFAYISSYRSFLSGSISTNQFNIPQVSNRVKAQNSLESKIQRYIDNKDEHGLSPINKCVNDLFGVRIVYSGKIDFEDFKNHIESQFDLKCIKALREDYEAIHIYFKKDNYLFYNNSVLKYEKGLDQQTASKGNLLVKVFRYRFEYSDFV